MLNSLGMSESVLLLIERRSKMDLLIFVILAVCLLAFIYFLVVYVKGSAGGGVASTINSSDVEESSNFEGIEDDGYDNN